MKSFIVRNIDGLGRIVLPKEWRTLNKIDEKDPLELHIKGSSITIKKYEDSCVFCGKHTNLQEYKNKQICQQCIDSLANK